MHRSLARRLLVVAAAALALNSAACTAPAAGATAAPAGAGAPAACSQPYFPLSAGARWTYSDGRTWAVTALTGSEADATVSIELTISKNGGAHTSQWECRNGQVIGGVLATLYGVEPSSGGGVIPGGQTLVSTSGQFLPEAGRLTANAAWTQTFSEQLQVTSGGTTSSTIEKYTVASAGPVTFNGQTFDGLKLTGQRTVDQAQDVGGQVTRTAVSDVTFELTLAKGVGLLYLKVLDGVTGRGGELQLTDYRLP